MPSSTSWISASPLVPIVILTALALPYCINLGVPRLWDPNEAFYAETPREMLETGNFIAPQFNYRPRTQKPPLTYWAILACYKAFGISEFSVRLPAAVASIGLIFCVYAIGKTLFSQAGGLIAAAVAATTFRTIALARRLPIDALLLFWLFGTAYFMIRGIRSKSRVHWAAAYCFAAFGVLTKGPMAVAIPATAYLIWAIWNRSLFRSSVYPLMGCGILLALVSPWYLLTYISSGWEYITPFFLKDNLGRFASESFGPKRGVFFYLGNYIADFLPWSLLSFAGIACLWAREKAFRPLSVLSWGYPLVWCGSIFLFFSLSKNKQFYYIASIYPMMAVLLGGVFERALIVRDRQMPTWERYIWQTAFCTSSLVLIAAAFLILFLLPAVVPIPGTMLYYLPSGILIAGAVFLGLCALGSRWSHAIATLVLSLWFVNATAVCFYLPRLDQFHPVSDLCRIIESRLHAGDEVGYYRVAVPSMAFYLRRPIFEEVDPQPMLRRFQSPARVFCILGEEEYKYFSARGDVSLHELNRRPRYITQLRRLLDRGSQARPWLLLVTNRPSDPPPAGDREGQ